jgi:hypothetical protein
MIQCRRASARYKVRLRKDKRGVNLISDVLPQTHAPISRRPRTVVMWRTRFALLTTNPAPTKLDRY